MRNESLANLETLIQLAREGDESARAFCERAWNAIAEERVLLTQPELATALGVSARHVRALTAKGALPVVRVGDSPRYRLEDCLAALGRASA